MKLAPDKSFRPGALVDLNHIEFESAVKELNGLAGAYPPATPPIKRPSPVVYERAEKVLLKLIDQADSIIANPAELAERAWEIAEAMQAAYESRCK